MAKKIIRRSLITLLVIIGVIVAIQIFAIVMVNPNAYKGFVQERLAQATGREVVIGGDFNYTLSLVPTISADALSIKDRQGNEFITVSDLSVSPNILSLLHGKLAVQNINLSGVRFIVDDSSDLKFTPHGKKEEPSQKQDSVSSNNKVIAIRNITLSDAMMVYFGREYKIGQVKLAGLHFPLEKSQTINIEFDNIGTRSSQLDGVLTVSPNDKSYTISGLIEASRFNLADLKTNKTNAKTGQSVASTGDWLHTLNVDINIRLHEVVYGQAQLGEISMNVAAQNGKMTVDIIETPFGDGKISGRFALENNNEDTLAPLAMAMEFYVDNLNYGRLSNEISGITILSGRADFSAELASAASDMGKLVDNLDGRFEIIAEDGRIDTGLIDMWASNLVTQMIPGLSHQTTNLNCAVARFDVKSGIAKDQGILVDTGRVTIAGKASIDLAQNTIDMVLKPKAKDPGINFATAVRVYGDLSDPNVGPDVRDLATQIGGLALGAINPLALVVPLVDLGSGEENPCIAALNNVQDPEKPGTVNKAVDKAKQFLDKLF